MNRHPGDRTRQPSWYQTPRHPTDSENTGQVQQPPPPRPEHRQLPEQQKFPEEIPPPPPGHVGGLGMVVRYIAAACAVTFTGASASVLWDYFEESNNDLNVALFMTIAVLGVSVALCASIIKGHRVRHRYQELLTDHYETRFGEN